MKYAIIKVVNGNYFIDSEGYTDLKSAKTNFHGVCQTLWNASDVTTASIMIVDENLDCVEGYKEFISHPIVEEVIPAIEDATEETENEEE